MQSQQELLFCCAAAPPCPTAALALEELLRSTFFNLFFIKVIVLACTVDHSSATLLLLPPSLPPWPRLLSSCRCACVSRFCAPPAEHVQALRLSSGTDNPRGYWNIPALSHKAAAAHQGDGIASRYQVSEREPRASSAWNICLWTHTCVEPRWKILWRSALPPSVGVEQRSCSVRPVFSLSERAPDAPLLWGVKSKQERWSHTWFYPCTFNWNVNSSSVSPVPPPPPRKVETSSKPFQASALSPLRLWYLIWVDCQTKCMFGR